jgi:putative transposase
VRNINPEEILGFVSSYAGVEHAVLHRKSRRKFMKVRALAAFLMRKYCNYKCSDMCRLLGNITPTRVSALTNMGFKMVEEEKEYENLTNIFLEKYGLKRM